VSGNPPASLSGVAPAAAIFSDALRCNHGITARHKAKFWLDPVRLEQSGGFRSHEINRIQQLIQKNQRLLLESWNEYFND
jgi:hypothetical protein